MNRHDFLYGFEFQQEAAFHQHIKPKRFLKYQALILNLDDPLVHSLDAAEAQLSRETFFVDAFNETGPFQTVNLNGSADYQAAKFVSAD